MGLTISYSLGLSPASIEQARENISMLHHHASGLSLLELGDITELEAAACRFKEHDPHFNLKHGALRMGDIAYNLNHRASETSCTHLIGFNVLPGHGCGETSFGLATHEGEPMSWQWYGYCKTQYASNPENGGIGNFIKCHLSILSILQFASETGILAEAIDPSGFWENREPEALVKHVMQENMLTAAVLGHIKDALQPLGYIAVAPTLNRADFEYLEAEGQDLLTPGSSPQAPPDQP